MTSRSNLSRQYKRQVIETYGTTCHICHQPINLALDHNHRDAFSIDHLIPLADGGPTTLDTLRPAHRRCNSSRAEGPKTNDGPVHTRDW